MLHGTELEDLIVPGFDGESCSDKSIWCFLVIDFVELGGTGRNLRFFFYSKSLSFPKKNKLYIHIKYLFSLF